MGLLQCSLVVAVCLMCVRSVYNKHHQRKVIKVDIGIAYDKAAVERALQASHLNKSRDLIPETKRLLRETQKLFNHHSLGHVIKLNLLKTRFLKKTVYVGIGDSARISAEELIRSHCLWQRIIKERDGMNYISVLITGRNLYIRGQEGRLVDKKGVAYDNSYCKKAKSCSVLKWQNTKALAVFLAHEIGHSIGMRHDTVEGCDPVNSIMTKRIKINKHLHRYGFTKCSAASLGNFLASNKGSCLR